MSREKMKEIKRKKDIEQMYKLIENLTHIEYVDLTKDRNEYENLTPSCNISEADEPYFGLSKQH